MIILKHSRKIPAFYCSFVRGCALVGKENAELIESFFFNFCQVTKVVTTKVNMSQLAQHGFDQGLLYLYIFIHSLVFLHFYVKAV